MLTKILEDTHKKLKILATTWSYSTVPSYWQKNLKVPILEDTDKILQDTDNYLKVLATK